ncbi:hypothetical protein OIU76_016391 [Salix suchowensis]|nr:hypothetical protein OIU76_016391 [Salix suchowensis]
MERRQG